MRQIWLHILPGGELGMQQRAAGAFRFVRTVGQKFLRKVGQFSHVQMDDEQNLKESGIVKKELFTSCQMIGVSTYIFPHL
jgi:hypothetical protein